MERYPGRKAECPCEKVLADLTGKEDRKQTLIANLLRQRAEAMKAFDDTLATLGYQAKDGAGQAEKTAIRGRRPRLPPTASFNGLDSNREAAIIGVVPDYRVFWKRRARLA